MRVVSRALVLLAILGLAGLVAAVWNSRRASPLGRDQTAKPRSPRSQDRTSPTPARPVVREEPQADGRHRITITYADGTEESFWETNEDREYQHNIAADAERRFSAAHDALNEEVEQCRAERGEAAAMQLLEEHIRKSPQSIEDFARTYFAISDVPLVASGDAHLAERAMRLLLDLSTAGDADPTLRKAALAAVIGFSPDYSCSSRKFVFEGGRWRFIARPADIDVDVSCRRDDLHALWPFRTFLATKRDFTAHLELLATDPSQYSELRRLAVIGLAVFPTDGAECKLGDCARNETDPGLRAEMLITLGGYRSPGARSAFLASARDEADPLVLSRVLEFLPRAGPYDADVRQVIARAYDVGMRGGASGPDADWQRVHLVTNAVKAALSLYEHTRDPALASDLTSLAERSVSVPWPWLGTSPARTLAKYAGEHRLKEFAPTLRTLLEKVPAEDRECIEAALAQIER